MRTLPVFRTRGSCVAGPRPCREIACRHHLDAGEPRFRPILPPNELDDLPSCSLDVADEGEHDREYIGALLGISRERVRQIEDQALRKLKQHRPKRIDLQELRDGWAHDESRVADNPDIVGDYDFHRAVDLAYRRIVPGAGLGRKRCEAPSPPTSAESVVSATEPEGTAA